MDFIEKLEWLTQYGDTSREGWKDQRVHLTWVPKYNAKSYFDGGGATMEDAVEELFFSVKSTLHGQCNIVGLRRIIEKR